MKKLNKILLALTIALIVTTGANATPPRMLNSGTTAVEVPITDAGNTITAIEVEGALQENRTAIDLNTAKDTNVPVATDPIWTAAGELAIGTGVATAHKLAAGATTDIFVGGGAADPVWTTSTGTGAPVRADTPTLITPELGVATGTTITLIPSTLPGIEFTDSDGADNDVSAKIDHNLTTTTTAVEIGDMCWQTMGAAGTAGTLETFMQFDGSAKSFSIIGSQIRSITTVNAATYDLLVSDYILNVTYTATAAVTSLTLPTAQVVSGRIIHIKDSGGSAGANNITIDTEASETIDGAATLVISTNYGATSLYSDGTNWFIF